MIEAERLKIDQAEVAIQAKAEGVKIRSTEQQSRDKLNLEMIKAMSSGKNTTKKE
jgi:hypothetical protein